MVRAILTRVRAAVRAVCGVAALLFVVVAQPLYLLPVEQQLPVVLGLVVLTILAATPLAGQRSGVRAALGQAVDLVLAVAGVGFAVYLGRHYQDIIGRQGAFTAVDTAVAAAGLVVVLEAVRRSVGWPFTLLCLAFLGYALAGPYMPSVLVHRGYTLGQTASELMLSYTGVLGTPLRIMVQSVVIFLAFGAVLQAVGASRVLLRLAEAVAGRFTGGLGKVAVLGSALVGTVSGSAAGNVATTGTVTIPAMKQGGYPPHVAGAIEALASTGGQIMPPVMGAAAFLMADYLGVPYGRVALAATLPALLYFLAAWVAVDLFARGHGLRGAPSGGGMSAGQVLREGWLYLLPVVAIYVLLVRGYSPTLSALVGIALAAVLLVVRRARAKELLDALVQAGDSTATLCAVAAGAGVVVGVLQMTGMGARLASMLVDLSRGSSLVLLVLTMVTSVIMGMGMPTTVVYVLLASLVVPALTRMGVTAMAAHFFIFYFGVLAAITPPVALASYAAASIAQDSPGRTGWMAFKMALPAFAVPFVFVREPALLFQGSIAHAAAAALAAGMSVYALGAAVMNHLAGPMPAWLRVVTGAAGVLLAGVHWQAELAGLGLLAVATGVQVARVAGERRRPPAAAAAQAHETRRLRSAAAGRPQAGSRR